MKNTKILRIIMSFIMIFQLLLIPRFESHAEEYSEFILSGQAHVQTYGDKDATWDGETLVLGTTGESKRLESIVINMENNTCYSGTIQYRVHRQTYGWTDWVTAGEAAGTTGESKRLEAIQIELTGELAEYYSVRYRVHAQTYGWEQGWQYDGALAGTTGESKRLESLEVQIVPKTEAMGVTYRVHRQTYGWESAWAKEGSSSGTTGESKRLEGITIALTGNEYEGGIKYRTHVQSYGWLDWVSDGIMSGTQGESKRLEAIQIKLTGEVAEYYDVYYRVHAQSYGWQGWAKNGEPAGTSSQSKRLEAIQIVLVEKSGEAPSDVAGITSVCETAYNVPESHTHTWKEATCTEPKTCDSCGIEEGEALGHSYSEYICTVCGDKDEEGIAMNPLLSLQSGKMYTYREKISDTRLDIIYLFYNEKSKTIGWGVLNYYTYIVSESEGGLKEPYIYSGVTYYDCLGMGDTIACELTDEELTIPFSNGTRIVFKLDVYGNLIVTEKTNSYWNHFEIGRVFRPE